jgi:hypothetical protein
MNDIAINAPDSQKVCFKPNIRRNTIFTLYVATLLCVLPLYFVDGKTNAA